MLSRTRSTFFVTTICRRSSFLRGYSTIHDAEDRDVVIVGGGPAGLALASALGSSQAVRKSLKMTVVDAGDLSKIENWSMDGDEFSNRVSSLTNGSIQFLKGAGAWDRVEQSRTCAIEEMQVWDGVSDARITFSAADLPLQAQEMSRMTENLNLQRGLLKHLSQIPEIQLLDNVRVTTIGKEDGANGWSLVSLSNGQTFRTRLLVGADGPNSPVRAFAGITTHGWAYDTHAVVATLSHAPRAPFQPPNTTAYQRFLPTGPIAFLPLSATESSMVWSTKPALAAALKSIDPSALANFVNAAFRLPEVSIRYLHDLLLSSVASRKTLTADEALEEIQWRERSHNISTTSAYSSALSTGEVGIPPEGSESLPPLVTSIQSGTVASFPLRYSHADTYIADGGRVVLVGDAAHTVHPLAGQGLNAGLADVQVLAQTIETALLQGGDIGSRTALLPYTRARWLENHKILAAVDKLHKLYSTTLPPVVWARSVGLEVINELDTIKAALMVTAGGGGGGSRMHGGAWGWDVAAKSLENLDTVANAAKVAGSGLVNVVGAGLQQLGNAFSQNRR
ncbi:ubiquinone biosynthesis hydrox [Thelephora terrestris]|uniref:Ubiquinone biosynthesis monooxygenase COQ6, mitochondrial n=1 Tax=Thelephora terrestris TaxID=56493 RepID=A0A9P6HI13_9AGAM|nr:ubiquinone biosynthesis hydrox [Thelephora terrestris]